MDGIHSQRLLLMSKWSRGTNLPDKFLLCERFTSKVYNLKSETATKGVSMIGEMKLEVASYLRESKIHNDDDLVPCSESSNISDDLT